MLNVNETRRLSFCRAPSLSSLFYLLQEGARGSKRIVLIDDFLSFSLFLSPTSFCGSIGNDPGLCCIGRNQSYGGDERGERVVVTLAVSLSTSWHRFFQLFANLLCWGHDKMELLKQEIFARIPTRRFCIGWIVFPSRLSPGFKIIRSLVNNHQSPSLVEIKLVLILQK